MADIVNSPVNFHQLHIFYTVANHGSFSKAAEVLGISQPAVSIQVQELEKFLRATLFHRRTRGLRLTEAGESVLSYSQQIFALSQRLVDSVQELEGLKSGRLTLGASTTPGEFVLPLAVGQFRQIYPGIRVELSIANTRTIVQRILAGEVDLGMVGERPQAHAEDLEMVDYVDDEIVLVASPEHPLAKQAVITPAQAVAAGLIVREAGSATRQTAERHFAALGLQPEMVLVLGSNHAVKQAAVGGGGVGVISRLGITSELKAGVLCVLNVQGWDCRRPLTLVYSRDRYLSPAQRAFLRFLESQRLGSQG
ncbi:MAG: LysR family transcriptional regulator [SAR202 cluster bacterium]|nr:LysR family transcriptional regulator [SAR202 cluster bacterium]